MTPPTLAHFAQLLRKRRSDLAAPHHPLDSDPCDALCQQLRAVERALERIELGRYGVCEYCGARLDLRRLEALPSARLCLPCARATSAAVVR